MLWRIAQLLGVAATALLVVGLVAWPQPSLAVLWNVAVPLLPATFLVSPALWRNVCPLATLNMLTNRAGSRRVLEERWAPLAGLVGIALLAILVPARRFLLNTDGTALAVVIVAVALVALLAGARFDLKAGFCNAICPVLPVERLYGQRPLAAIGNPRCRTCTLCTRRGCLDLAPEKSVPQTLGRSRRTSAWLLTAYGIFAAAFPGFVAGYYLSHDVPLAEAGSVYLRVFGWAAASYAAWWLLVRAFRPRAELAMTLLAALAVGLYYWFAPGAIGRALGLSPGVMVSLRLAAFAVVGLWLVRALRAVAEES